MSDVFDLRAMLSADVSPFNNAMDSASATVGSSASAIASAIKGNMGSVINVLIDATRRTYAFGQAIADISAISDLSMTKLRNGILKLDNVYGRVATVADSIYETISSGIEGTEESYLRFIQTLSHTSVSIRADLESTTNVMTTLMNAYSVSIEEASRLADMLFVTVKEGKAQGNELARTLGLVTNTAAESGITLSELSAVIATLSRTQSASQTMIAFNQLLNSLIHPTQEAQREASKWGIELGATALQTKGLTAILTEMHQKVGGNAAAINAMLGNIRAMRAGITLTGDQFQNFLDIVETAEATIGSGVAEEAFEKQTATMAQAVENLGVQIDKTLIHVGSTYESVLVHIVQGTEGMLRQFTEGDKTILNVVNLIDNISDEGKESAETWQKWSAGIIRASTVITVVLKIITSVRNTIKQAVLSIDTMQLNLKRIVANTRNSDKYSSDFNRQIGSASASSSALNNELNNASRGMNGLVNWASSFDASLKSANVTLKSVVAQLDIISSAQIRIQAEQNVSARRLPNGQYRDPRTGRFVSYSSAVDAEAARIRAEATRDARHQRAVELQQQRHADSLRRARLIREQRHQRAVELQRQRHLRQLEQQNQAISASTNTLVQAANDFKDRQTSILGAGLRGIYKAFMVVSQAIMAWDIGTNIGNWIRHTFDTDERISGENERLEQQNSDADAHSRKAVRYRAALWSNEFSARQNALIQSHIGKGDYTAADALISRYLQQQGIGASTQPERQPIPVISDIIAAEEALRQKEQGIWVDDTTAALNSTELEMRHLFTKWLGPAYVHERRLLRSAYPALFGVVARMTAGTPLAPDDMITIQRELQPFTDALYRQALSVPSSSDVITDMHTLRMLAGRYRLLQSRQSQQVQQVKPEDFMPDAVLNTLRSIELGLPQTVSFEDPQQRVGEITDYTDVIKKRTQQLDAFSKQYNEWMTAANGLLGQDDVSADVKDAVRTAIGVMESNYKTAVSQAFSFDTDAAAEDIASDIALQVSNSTEDAVRGYITRMLAQLQLYSEGNATNNTEKAQFANIRTVLLRKTFEYIDSQTSTINEELKSGVIGLSTYVERFTSVISSLTSLINNAGLDDATTHALQNHIRILQRQLRETRERTSATIRDLKVRTGMLTEHAAISEQITQYNTRIVELERELGFATGGRRSAIIDELLMLGLNRRSAQRQQADREWSHSEEVMRLSVGAGLSTDMDMISATITHLNAELSRLASEFGSTEDPQFKARLQQDMTTASLRLLEAFNQLQDASVQARNAMMSQVQDYISTRDSRGNISNNALFHSLNMMSLAGQLPTYNAIKDTMPPISASAPPQAVRDRSQEALSRSIDAWLVEQKYSQANIGQTVSDIYDYMISNKLITLTGR